MDYFKNNIISFIIKYNELHIYSKVKLPNLIIQGKAWDENNVVMYYYIFNIKYNNDILFEIYAEPIFKSKFFNALINSPSLISAYFYFLDEYVEKFISIRSGLNISLELTPDLINKQIDLSKCELHIIVNDGTESENLVINILKNCQPRILFLYNMNINRKLHKEILKLYKVEIIT